MREWVEHTTGRIRALGARRVLEVGCGTGLLLFRVAPECQRYTGVDFSAQALDRIRAVLATHPLPQVDLRQASAHEIDGLDNGSYDAVVINSVIQYFPSVDHLVVIPQMSTLPMVRLAGEYAGAGESRARSVAVHGDDDAATREYRHGDDLRRVHWRSTARTGELMVRREEQPWESRATVVLDTRAHAHRGEGPTASFEWAVSAAASIVEHLRHAGYKARLVTDTGVDIDASGGDTSLLDYLAEVQPSQHGDLSVAVDQVRRRSDGGLVIAILGLLDSAEADLLAGLRRNGTTCVALLINSTTWLNLATALREAADAAHATAGLGLLRTGWRVIDVPHGTRLPAIWPQVGRGSQGFAWRATLAETVSGGVR